MSRRIAAALLCLASCAAGAAECDPKPGRRSFENKCAICHAAEAGAPHTVGPNLHGVVGRPIGREPGFSFAEPLARAEGQWTAQRLDEFLHAPQQAFPGTAMPFQGLKSESERQRLICYLQTLKSSNP